MKYRDDGLGRRAREDPRLRHFRSLGYSVVLVPAEVAPSRNVARMMIGTMYGFDPDEITSLRARRLALDGEPERTWWVMAIPTAAIDRRTAGPGRRNDGRQERRMAENIDRDDTIILRVERWAVRGEKSPRLALHVHGGKEAFAVKDKIANAFRALVADAVTGPRLDLAELDTEVRRIGERLGLTGYAGECKCRLDPLRTTIDASVYRPASHERGG